MQSLHRAADEVALLRTGRFEFWGLRLSGFLDFGGGPRRFRIGGLPSFSSRNSSSSGQDTGILFLR